MFRNLAYGFLLLSIASQALGAERLRLGPTPPLPLQIVGAAFETADGDLRTVPESATAASLNVTVVNPAGEGYLTVWPCGVERPLASNINFTAGSVVPNGVLAYLGGDGAVCLFSSVDTDVIVDVSGWFDGEVFAGVTPVRLLDSREGAGRKLAAGRVAEVLLKGRTLSTGDRVPTTASAVSLNVTVTGAEAPRIREPIFLRC